MTDSFPGGSIGGEGEMVMIAVDSGGSIFNHIGSTEARAGSGYITVRVIAEEPMTEEELKVCAEGLLKLAESNQLTQEELMLINDELLQMYYDDQGVQVGECCCLLVYGSNLCRCLGC